MNCEFDNIGNVLLVKVEGRLVAACSDEFQNDVIERTSAPMNIVFDLSEMSHIDSAGLGALVFMLQKASANGGTVKLACLQPRPRIIFEITKVFRVFELFDTVEAALASFPQK